jgi:hypothetical protein
MKSSEKKSHAKPQRRAKFLRLPGFLGVLAALREAFFF